jgi:hypothetical protein
LEQLYVGLDASVPFVPNEDSKLLKVARFPIAKVNFLNRHSRGDPPAKLRLVREPNAKIQEAFLKLVFNPVHDLPM